MSSSAQIGNENKDIFTSGERPTQGLDDTTLTAEAKNILLTLHNQEKICIDSSL